MLAQAYFTRAESAGWQVNFLPADARALSVERVRLVRDGCASVREFVGFMIRVCPRGPNAIGESLKFVAQGLGVSFPWSGCVWCGMGVRV